MTLSTARGTAPWARPCAGEHRRRLGGVVAAAVCVWAIGPGTFASASTPRRSGGPTIGRITTSTTSFSIDCPPTSVRVSARVTAASGVRRVVLRFRVDAMRPYSSKVMTVSGHTVSGHTFSGHTFSATVTGAELPAGPYGALRMSITAQDARGRTARSPVDTSVQFLPCVGA